MNGNISPRLRSLPATPNQFLGGPTSGTSASPGTFRSLVLNDLQSSVVAVANTVYAGPTGGGDAAATFRELVLSDMPADVVTNTVNPYVHLWFGGL